MKSMRRVILFITALAIAQGQSAAAVWAYAAQDRPAPDSYQELGEPLDAASNGATAISLNASYHLRPLATATSGQALFQLQLRGDPARQAALGQGLGLKRLDVQIRRTPRRYASPWDMAALVLTVGGRQVSVRIASITSRAWSTETSTTRAAHLFVNGPAARSSTVQDSISSTGRRVVPVLKAVVAWRGLQPSEGVGHGPIREGIWQSQWVPWRWARGPPA